MKRIITFTVILLLCNGCATSGISGTTTLSTKYDSNVLADGSEHTIFEQTAKGKAGDVLQAVSQASLDTADGTGSRRTMSVGANQSNDALRRADSVDNEVNKRFEMFNNGIALGGSIAALAAPLIGQNMTLDAQTEAARIQSRTQLRSQFLQAFPELSQLPQLVQMLQNPNVLRALGGQRVPPVVVEPPVVEPPPAPAPEPPTPLTDVIDAPVVVTE